MNKIRFGIVGTGTIAHRFANAIKNVPQAELVAVASRKMETAARFADEFRIPLRFASYEDMACSDAVDAAYIAVPHGGHKDASVLMLSHKKAVLCEKPMAINAREEREMIASARENGAFLMEAMWGSLVPGTVKLREIVKEGVLGDLMGARGDFCYNMDDELDHHIFDNAQGGGSLLDVGVYGLYFLLWYLGKEVTEIKTLSHLQYGVDAHTNVLVGYQNGAIGNFSSAVLLQKPNEGAVYGTKGYAVVHRFYAPEKIEIFLRDGTHEIIDVPYRGNGFEEQIAHMCDCLGRGLTESPVNTFENSVFIAEQMDEIRRQAGLRYPQDR